MMVPDLVWVFVGGFVVSHLLQHLLLLRISGRISRQEARLDSLTGLIARAAGAGVKDALQRRAGDSTPPEPRP